MGGGRRVDGAGLRGSGRGLEEDVGGGRRRAWAGGGGGRAWAGGGG